MSSSASDALFSLLDTLYHGALNERDKGSKFERLMKSYLTTDPVYGSEFSNVWLWNEYPGRNGRTDIGVDLVAKNAATGELTAIQCKFLDPQSTVSKPDIDSFLAASSRSEFEYRMLVSTSAKGLGPNAQAAIQNVEPSVSVLNIHDLARADIAWQQFSIQAPEKMVRAGGRKAPREHQREAMAAVKKGFVEHDRGKMIMACGTGKTYTALQLVENQTPSTGTVLFLVPSIALLSQTLREWKNDATEDFRAVAVCSDVKVGKNTDEDVSTTDLAVPATTDASRLVNSRKLAKDYPGRTVVFSTYQSIDVVAEAQARGFGDFDLVICDEAHRTTGATIAGRDESAFVKIHDNSFIHAEKRLYMTATPRVFDETTKAKAEEKSVAVASMDDTSKFGPEFYHLGFGTAVEKQLLADYKVLVLAVDENAVNDQLQSLLTDDEGELGIDDVARIVGCWNGLATRGADDPAADKTANAVGRPMRRAVAFASNIKESKRVAGMFSGITKQLAEDSSRDLVCEADHVDGGMNVAVRNEKLRWLEAEPDPGECRILTNARCLSEGVDVPTLDAVMFLNPRNSQVDVVQSVGRVMRTAPGKDYGYIILPVGIPTGMTPEQALKDSKRYKVIWSVLNALRSHDDRFEAKINKIDLNEARDETLQVIGVGTGADEDEDPSVSTPQQLAFDLEFPGADQWRDAIYAKIVQKVGDREYWENWSKDIAEVAGRHTRRIHSLVNQNPTPEVQEAFSTFVEALKANLNQGIGAEDAVSMLSQHLITKPVFDALFQGYDFAAHNPVSQAMDAMLATLEGNNLTAETESLNDFYASVARRAAGINNPDGKQKIITELYEKFFKTAFPKQADALGVVYTPVEIVDFIIHAVDDLSKIHYGAGLTDEGVHVLDPFTGTGTFIVRLLESGVITSHDLARKYANELHANELMLLAYYIAAINIEATYHGIAGGDYAPFEGIVLTDTFQMSEDGDTLDTEVFTTNNHRAARQLDTDIRVIVGNPPYSSGQNSANDNNANQTYPTLDASIRDTYAKNTTGQNRNSLYDSYIRAIRWGTNRIGDRGILAYVTNGGYIDSNSADGLRKSLAEDFDHLYVYNLRGNQRTAGEQSRREGGKIFGAGSRATVAIMIGVKDPSHAGDCVLHYRDIGDYLTREDKLAIVRDSTITSTRWESVTPNAKGEWINQSSDFYDTLPPLGDKKGSAGHAPIFRNYGRGLASGRDAWVYNFSEVELTRNMRTLIETYNEDRETFRPTGQTADERLAQAKAHATYDPSKISWNRGTFNDLANNKPYEFEDESIRVGIYRPFTKQRVYFNRQLNDMIYQLPSMFPTPSHPNYGFYLAGMGSAVPFSVIALDSVPDLHVTGAGSGGQFFARYTYRPVSEGDMLTAISENEETTVDGFLREDNVSDDALDRYRNAFGKRVSKDDIFANVYAMLHSPQYRETYAAELKRQLPRVPLPETTDAFQEFAEAGRALMALHIGYETVEPYPLVEEHVADDEAAADYYRVEKLRWGGKSRTPDKSKMVYNQNVALSGIPEQAHGYVLGSRSALEWLIDRYQVKTDKASGIVNDPNDWAEEHGDPRYVVDLIKRVTTVSVETQRILQGLPELPLE
ncbi:type ISP restriction/modification enzyme [Nesterenkonia sp. Act20]|uniref:DEAD/DEAH box helicase n=1 Tax=Nesterenkonia sp. Act20 TaxID=1483432 RepID=UPI001C471F1F|nr:type ISP restriction/modification enzyme [Nesterenkonia sp. Act20]